MSEGYKDTLRAAIKRLHGCDSTHVRTEKVAELHGAIPVWAGEVEVFDLTGHPKAKRAYAWSFENDKGKKEHVAVLELPPVMNAQTAVQAYLISLSRKQ